MEQLVRVIVEIGSDLDLDEKIAGQASERCLGRLVKVSQELGDCEKPEA
jgi:hypothetical protein